MLDDARAGDLAVLGDVADQDDRRRRWSWRKRISACAGGADLGDGARRASTVVGPHGLDRIDHHQGRARAFGQRRDDVLDIGLGGEITGASASPMRSARSRTCARSILRPRHRRRGGRRAPAAQACISRVDLPMPGSPPISSTEPRTKPPPVTRSSSPMPESWVMRGASSGRPAPPRTARTRSPSRVRLAPRYRLERR
jgi:hypothetical protein